MLIFKAGCQVWKIGLIKRSKKNSKDEDAILNNEISKVIYEREANSY